MDLVVRIFELAKYFPSDERYALTDQIRRSSRSVCAEAAETQVHIEIALRHNYLSQETFEELDDAFDKILAQIVKMIDQSERWVLKARRGSSPK
jgi:propanediol utilization protein